MIIYNRHSGISFEKLDEIFKWLENNVGEQNEGWLLSLRHVCFLEKHREAATLFKLRYGSIYE